MTNEELAIDIKNGNKEACSELWKQLEKLIKKQAFSYYNKLESLHLEYIPDAERRAAKKAGAG